MLTIKKPAGIFFCYVLAVCVLVSGCTPAGPRALLQGERLLTAGRYPEATEKLKLATTLLNTNAHAWNHLGLALHNSGDLTNAVQAYAQALKLNRDLVEAHFNLGCVLLDLNRLENAKVEFSAFTLRRGNSAAGWLKLGSAQLRSKEVAAAEKSFSEALRLNPQNPEALNGLGIIQMQRNHATEAAQAFNAALQQQSDYAPALLNLAIVSQVGLNNRSAATQKYREYLALPVRPQNWEAVSAVVAGLDQETKNPTRTVSSVASVPAVSNSFSGKTNVVIARLNSAAKIEATSGVARPLPNAMSTEPVKVASLPEAQLAKDAGNASTDPNWSEPPAVRKPGFLQRLFHPGTTPATKVKPSSPPSATPAAIEAPESAGGNPGSPTSVNVARYKYHSISKPVAGNRLAAEKHFMQALQSQRAGDWSAAMQSYARATALDPAYFEAYYNLALAAAAAGDAPQALSAGEYALSIRPDSVEARLNFAQQLKQVNFSFDAANELTNVLVKNPAESRAHLALGNLYAQQFHQNSKAREHYLKVLENDPRNPQAAAIRDWLVSNPK